MLAGTILDRIVAHKRQEVAAAKERVPASELKARLAAASPTRGFVRALATAGRLGLIAEVKRASPSAGVIRQEVDPVATALAYQGAGANCLSVLTDQEFFHGTLDDLVRVRAAVAIPVLRKDFILDEYQLLEARVAGADAVLLIAECLPAVRLAELYHAAGELGLDCLIELYDEVNIDAVLALNPALVGVNNRDLRSFEVSLQRTLDLAPRITPRAMLVSESGIRTRDDVQRLRQGGVGALLIGETLMRSGDVAATVQDLLTP